MTKTKLLIASLVAALLSGCGDAPIQEGPLTAGGTDGGAACVPRVGIYHLTYSLISATGSECLAKSPIGTTTSADIDIETSKMLIGLQCSKQITGTSCDERTSYICQNDDGTPPRTWDFAITWNADGSTGSGTARYTATYPDPAGYCELVLALSYVKL